MTTENGLNVEQVKAFLESDEGKKLIDDTDAVKSLRNKRDELLNEKDKWKQKWTQYESLGDLETLKKALEASTKNDKDKITVDPDLVESLKNQLTERDQALDLFKNNFIKSQVDSKIESAIVEAKGNSRLLKHIVQERIKTTLAEDGQVQIEVYTKDGKKMFRNDSSPASISDLIAELRDDEDLGIAFASSGANGSGSRPNTSKVGGVILDRNDPNFDASKAMAWYARHGYKK